MASLAVEGDRLVVRLSATERVLAVSLSEPSVPLSAVRSVRAVRHVRSAIHGIRAPGTGVPGLAWLGQWRGRGHDFVAVYGDHAGVVVELAGTSYDRFVVSVDDPEGVVEAIEAGRATSP